MGDDARRKVLLKKDPKDGILSYCKMKHPNEGILILKGKSKKGIITIDSLVIPPFSICWPHLCRLSSLVFAV